jgi:hypothetical protein
MQGDVRSSRSVSAHPWLGSWSASQSGASSVGPSEQVGGEAAALFVANGPARAEALAGCLESRPSAAARSVMKCLKPPLEQNHDLGPDAARARNRHSGSAARCAGCGGIGRHAGTPIEHWENPALHREAERDTTGSLNRQPAIHTWNNRGMQGKRRSAATLDVIRFPDLKLPLTMRIYCDKRAAPEGRFRWRAEQITSF